MNSGSSILLARDCQVVRIPAGEETLLKKGEEVVLTQSLGGTYTVHGPGGLYRINGKDGDALGFEVTKSGDNPDGSSHEQPEVTEKQVWDALRTCYDPEIPVNIVDLGLVYDLGLKELANGKSKAFVKMTLTAPGCGMGHVIAGDAQQKILGIPGVGDASVEIVWDPPWHQSMITAEGRKILGLD